MRYTLIHQVGNIKTKEFTMPVNENELRYAVVSINPLIALDRAGSGFDYTNNAWVVNYFYEDCIHKIPCKCFARINKGTRVQV